MTNLAKQNIDKKRKVQRSSVKDFSIQFGKVPPQSKDLEKAVLGAIMLEKNVMDTVMIILKPESFYVDAHQKIFRAMMALSQKYAPIDYFTVIEELIKQQDLELIGGPYYITQLTDGVVSAANVENHARVVAEKFMQRELIRIGGEIIGDAYEDSTDVFDLLDSVDSQITELIGNNSKRNYTSISDGIALSITRIQELKALESHMTGIPTGFTHLDKVTHGWQNTDLIILAARPAVGKTALALNIGRAAGGFFRSEFIQKKESDPNYKQKSVAFFSLEMSTGQLINRMISAETEIFLDKISNGQMDDDLLHKLTMISNDSLTQLPIFIDDTPSLNIFELRAKSRRLKNKHNVGIIIIDYLQLMSGSSEKNGNREQEISKISRDLKGLAKELRVPIIALSQLSREVEKRKGEIKMPQLSDLRESGAIEQDADMVLFLYRPEYYEVNTDEFGESNKGETHLKIAKHRNGTLETIKLKANLAIQKFYDGEQSDFGSNMTRIGGSWKPATTISDHFKDHFIGNDDDEPF